jgi:putative transposase
MSYRLIATEAEKAKIPVQRACDVLGVSESGYYAHQTRGPSRRQRDDLIFLVHVREAFRGSHGTYGSPRLTVELKGQNIVIGRRRVARLMRDNHLQGRRPRRWRRAANDDAGAMIAPNLLAQNFVATRPNEKWVSDISYIWTREGWLYLAAVVDLYARRVVGWATSDRLHTNLPLHALNRAVVMRRPPTGLILHSDRGCQYTSQAYQHALKTHGLLASMSRTGNCYDNAAMESFFKTIKSELIWRNNFLSRRQAHDMIAHYIDGFYNPTRRHSSCGYQSPADFERQMAA